LFALLEDAELCLNVHASVIMQLLLRVLHASQEFVLVSEAVAMIVCDVGKLSIERCEALLRSAPGSRTLEAVLETCGSEMFSSLFLRFFRTRLTALVSGDEGEFGAFLAQRVLDGLRDEPQLNLALQGIDFNACLGASSNSRQAVVVKLAEACLRIQAGFKTLGTSVFRSLDLKSAADFHRAWPTLLALERVDKLEDLLRTDASKAEEGSVAALRPLPSAGAQLVSALLRFPPEAVQPLIIGLPKQLKAVGAFNALARESKTARVLETALSTTSALPEALRVRLAHSFRGLLGGLGPHPIGGWVCVALWKVSLGHTHLRETFVKELLEVESGLREVNYAVWKVCGLNDAKLRQEEWSSRQKKAGKTKRLFENIVDGGDPEAAKAAAAARQRAAEDTAFREAEVAAKEAEEAQALADPMTASLLVSTRMDPDQQDEAAKDVPDEDIDRLFSGKRRRKERDLEKKVVAAPQTDAVPAAADHDADLLEALKLIKGEVSNNARTRRKRKARKIAEMNAATRDSESD